MEELISNAHAEVLGIPCVTDIFRRTNRRVIHNGNTMFLGFALADERAYRDPMAAILDRDFHELETEVTAKVVAQSYILVLFGNGPAHVLRSGDPEKILRQGGGSVLFHLFRPQPRLGLETEGARRG